MIPRPARPAGISRTRLVRGGSLVAVLTCLVPAAADAATPTLRATQESASSVREVRLALDLLDTRGYRVLRRPSAATVVVGFGARSGPFPGESREVRRLRRQPCATTTLRLRVVADDRTPLEYVRAARPESFGSEGAVTTAVTGEPATTPGAWRTTSDIRDSRVFVERGVAATALRPGLLGVLTTTSRTIDLGKVQGTACGGTSSYIVGPRVGRTIATFPLVRDYLVRRA